MAFWPFAILGFTPRFFLLAEIDLQNLYPAAGKNRWGIFEYLRLDYEVLRGLHALVTHEFGQSDFGNGKTESSAYGAGAQWFPRPHLELEGSFQKRRIGAVSSGFTDFAWLLMHFYL